MRKRIAIAICILAIGLSIPTVSAADTPQTTTPTTCAGCQPPGQFVTYNVAAAAQAYKAEQVLYQQQTTAFIAALSNDAVDADTPDWQRCVITPESGGNFSDTSGAYGILTSTWNSNSSPNVVAVWAPYGYFAYAGQAPPLVQAIVAEFLFRLNGGFGPNTWNNGAGCGKSG